MSACDILYRCPSCAGVRRQVDGKGPFTLEPGQFGCAVCENWAASAQFIVDKSGNGNHLSPQPSTPTCCNQPMQPSTSPYRWDTGELIKGKLLVCRECGKYREAEAGTLLIPDKDEQFLWSWEHERPGWAKIFVAPGGERTGCDEVEMATCGLRIGSIVNVDTLPIGSTLPNGETVTSTTRRSRG